MASRICRCRTESGGGIGRSLDTERSGRRSGRNALVRRGGRRGSHIVGRRLHARGLVPQRLQRLHGLRTRALRLQIENGLVRQPFRKLQFFNGHGDLLVAVLPQGQLRPHKISQLLKIHLKLRLQQETKTQQQADTAHIHYHDVPRAGRLPGYLLGDTRNAGTSFTNKAE